MTLSSVQTSQDFSPWSAGDSIAVIAALVILASLVYLPELLAAWKARKDGEK